MNTTLKAGSSANWHCVFRLFAKALLKGLISSFGSRFRKIAVYRVLPDTEVHLLELEPFMTRVLKLEIAAFAFAALGTVVALTFLTGPVVLAA